MYVRYFAVPFSKRELFKIDANKQLRKLKYRCSIIFDKTTQLWSLQSANKSILTAELHYLKEYEPEHTTLTEDVSFSDVSTWCFNKFSEYGLNVKRLEQANNRNNWKRCEVVGGKKNNLDGGYLFFFTGSIGVLLLQNYRTGEKQKFIYKGAKLNGKSVSGQELEELQLKNKAYFAQLTQIEKATEDKQKEENPSKLITWLQSNNANLVCGGSGLTYLDFKGLHTDKHTYICVNQCKTPDGNQTQLHVGYILLPIYSVESGSLLSFQIVKPNGEKRFLKNYGVKNGCLRLLHSKRANKVILCEGYATGSSIRAGLELLGIADVDIICCYSLGNLENISELLGESCKYKHVLVLADDDRDNQGKSKRELPEEKSYQNKSQVSLIKWITTPICDEEKHCLLSQAKANFDQISNCPVKFTLSKLIEKGVNKVKDFNDFYILCLCLGDVNFFKEVALRVVNSFKGKNTNV